MNQFIKAGFWFFGCLLSIQVMSQSAAVDPLTQVQTAITQRDWVHAEALLKPLIQTQGNNPFVMYDAAQIYENTNRTDAARQIYQTLASMPEAAQHQYVMVVRSPDLVARLPNVPTSENYMTNLVILSQARLDALNAISAKNALAAKKAIQVEAVPELPSPATLSAEILTAFKSWAKAWESQDLPNYYGSYVDDFQGAKLSNKRAWEKQRARLVKNKKIIALGFSDINVTLLKPDAATLTFTQSYKSNAYSDVVNKTLGMIKVNGRWLIDKETAEPISK